MKAKRITALLMALTLTAALSACGGSDKSSVSPGKEMETASKDEGILKMASAADYGAETVTKSAVSAVEEATGQASEVVAQAQASPELDTSPASDESKPKGSDSSGSVEPVTSKSKSDSSGSGGGSAPAPTQPAPVPVHTHSWKEHTVTEQVWVPNIVVVDDYEDRVIDMSYYECNCGEIFEHTDAGQSALFEHMENNALKAVANGTIDSCPCGGYLIYEKPKIERVKVGSHEEDHGHYENNTYVDYYYCDCGARK